MTTHYDGEAAIRPLEKILNQIGAAKGYDRHRVFEGFLDYLLAFFDPEQHKPDFWPFDHDDAVLFNEAMKAYFLIMNEQLAHTDWYDAFGDLYMAMHKKGNDKGQFFTPAIVADATARVNLAGMKRDEADLTVTPMGKRIAINDMAAGSGRFPLAAYAEFLRKMQREWQMSPVHTRAARPYLSCEDLDYMCVKMSAINICMHGAYGEAVCHNSLTEPEVVHLGYIINDLDWPLPSGVLSIRRVSDPKRFVCTSVWAARRQRKERNLPIDHGEHIKKEPVQLTLF